MKSLKFTHIEAENIRKGIQGATLRIGDEKDISLDDTIAIIDKVQEDDPLTWQIIGTAKVDKVTVQKFGDLDIDGADFEQFGSTSELYEQMALFYGDPIDEKTHVKVIHFSFKPYKNAEPLDKSVVTPTTIVREIKLYGDGGSRGNPGPSASGYVLMDMQDTILETNGEYLNITTNNQAEYHSLRLGLERARQLGAEIVHVYMDSMLVINQMKGIYKVKNKELQTVYTIVKGLTRDFKYVDFTHVPRELNKLADGEVNRILDSHQNMV
jgi:ribonuclease HI